MSSTEHIEKEAACWVVRLERGLSGAEQDEFLDWLTADPRHGDELNAQKAGWDKLDLLADWRPEHGARPNRDILAPAEPARRARGLPTYLAAIGALAAVVAVGFLVLRGPAPSGTDSPAVIALIEQRTLPDGSTVTMNRGAEISVDFSGGLRRVGLVRGEAHFQVAKDRARPFVVSAGGVDVRALGTAFNVKLGPATVDVLVTEGRVGVTRAGEPAGAAGGVEIAAGERTRVPVGEAGPAQVARVTEAETAALIAWQPRLLEFNEARLADIVAELNRRNDPIRIELADAGLAELPLNASIRSDNIEGFVRLLEGGHGVQAVWAGGRITLRLAPRE